MLANPCNYQIDDPSAYSTRDITTLIGGVDGFRGQRLNGISKYRGLVNFLTSQSKFFGEVWPTNSNVVLCEAFESSPPPSGRIDGSILDTTYTRIPILFVTSTLDPVTPQRGGHKISAVFPGSVVLT
ncbi:hypothetical protein BJX70DRAFT_399706 [Aspergillus crustosus]